MDEPASFGYWIRRRRKALDLTSDELAQRVGCAGVTIRKIEADERRPSRQIAERLAIYLEIPPADRPAFLQSARAELAVDHLAPPPKPPLSPPPPRRQIDRKPRQHAIKGYDLREPIGEGGFGTVYRAEQPGLGREVAVKIIRPEYANHPEFIRRFEAEAQIVARLEHPHIVPLYDYWRESSGAYLVMRYVRGGSLHTALRSGPWSLEQATRLLDQIGAALAFAHRHSVVHRDLKPANILLDEEGNTYLADFGIAKDLGAADAVGATQPGAIIGSPEHLSPEQIQDAPVTAQSDMFSLGVLLYEVLTGAHPFANLTPGERLYQQLQAPLPPLHARCPDLPGALNAVIQRATAKSPTDRYPDVASMVVGWQHALMEDEGQKAKDAPLLAMTPSSSVLRPSFESVTLTDLAVLENPYKGLRAFGEADAADFFGREALVQRLLERLAEPGVGDQGLGVGNYAEANSRTPIPHPPSSIPRFLAVVGPSGSGKSSVVRAGLIPALRRGGLPGSERWFVVELFPGAHPLEELEAALLRVAVNPPESLLGQLQEDQRGLARAVKRVLPSDEEIELVLVIDQFEELFTLTQDENVRAHILASLVAAVLDPRSRVRVIVTLRADFIDRPLQYVDFGELLRERTEFVLPLAPGELEQAIVGPAARVGVVPEPEVVVAIVENIGERPGALPLLQYALTELFERRQGRTLTLAAYRESGGIRGALARRADETYNKLDASEQEAVRQLFLRLITLGEGAEDTRRRVLHSELSALRKDERRTTNDDSHPTAPSSSVLRRPSAMDAVIDAYGRARLLSFDRDPITREPTVEVAHEALLREWGRLRAWLDASRADIRMQRLLAAAVAEWSAAGRDPSYLLSGVRLAQFEGWAAQTGLVLTLDERAFLDASLAERTEREAAEQARQQRELATARQLAEEQQRRADEQSRAAARLRRRALYLAGALALALLAASAAGIFANNNATLATQNADVARTAQIAGDEANHQRRAAEANLTRAEAERLAAEANRLVVERGNVDVATLLALRSVKMQYTPQGDEAVAGVSQLVYPERILTGHTGYVGRVRFTPDGRYLVSASIDGTVRVWDIQSGVTLHENRYPGWMLQVDISPDGMLFVSSGAEGMVYLTARASDVPQRQLVGHSGFVGGAVFSPDGHYVVTVGGDKTARLWDVQTGKEIRRFEHPHPVNAVAMSPDGRMFATGTLVITAGTDVTDPAIRLWDMQTGRLVKTLTGHTDVIADLAFSPDGARLLSASYDSTARLWDVQNGTELLRITGHTDWVSSVAFAPDGRTFLTGSNDLTIRLWDSATGAELQRLNAHADYIPTVAFSPDGQYVASASADSTIRLWRLRGRPGLPQFTGHAGRVTAASFARDGQTIMTGSEDGTVRLWNSATGEALRVLLEQHEPIFGIALSPDGRLLATAGSFNTIRLWNRETGAAVATLATPYTGSVWQVGFSPDGRYLAANGGDITGGMAWAMVWDVRTRQQVAQLRQPSGRSVDFSSDGRLLLTSAGDGLARVWDVEKQQLYSAIQVPDGDIWSAVFTPDGRSIVTGTRSGVVQIWDLATRAELRRFEGHRAPVVSLALSPDGRRLLTASEDRTARLWDVETGAELRRFVGHNGFVLTATFSPNGRYVLTGSGDRTARLWYISLDDAVQALCARLLRDFTPDERLQYGVPDDGPTCPKP